MLIINQPSTQSLIHLLIRISLAATASDLVVDAKKKLVPQLT